MSILVPGIGSVPVVWKPSDLTGPDSDGHVGRYRFGKSGTHQAILAIVHHRIVGSLETMTNSTFAPTTDDALVSGERRVSSHFGIGYWGTELRIVQFVALENTAYCNGQTDRDKAACTWQLWIDAGRPDANGMTVSIEHEDNGSAGAYVVREEIIKASVALDRLLLSGNGPAIRAAGIRCSDEAAAQLGRIAPSVQTLVPHRTVAPVSKPYCWTKIGDDAGFPQARYVAELAADTGDDMLVVVTSKPFDAPRHWSVAAGTTLRGYDPARPGIVVKAQTFAEVSGATADATVYVAYPGTTSAPVPKGGPFLHVVDGAFAGLLIVAAAVTLAPAPDLVAAARKAGFNDGRDAVLAAGATVPRQ